jgi:hypothetical protein
LLKHEIEKALDSDYKIEYYAPKKKKKGGDDNAELPGLSA